MNNGAQLLSNSAQRLVLDEAPREDPEVPSLAMRSEGHDEVLAAVMKWLQRVKARCLPARVVPGTTTAERVRLAALGGLIAGVFAGHRRELVLPAGVRQWMDVGPRAPSELVGRVKLVMRDRGAEFLAQLYERIVAGPHRRTLGTYFTPQATVDWMLGEWTTKEGTPRSVVDVGAGVGVFTASAAACWAAATVTAVDVNPVTLGVLAAQCMVTGAAVGRVRAVLDDYTAWDEHGSLPEPCLILGNPPYTRLQLLPMRDRKRLLNEVPDCGARAGLSTWILAATVKRLRDRDGILFLLPRPWIDAEYGRAVRERLWRESHRRVELTELSGGLFGEARVDAVTLLVGPKKKQPQPFVLRAGRDGPEMTVFERRGDAPAFVLDPRADAMANARRSARGVTLDSLAAVRRGTATGANEYFTLSDATVKAWSLSRSALRPVVRRLRDFSRDRVTTSDLARLDEDTKRWLFLATAKHVKKHASVRAYVRHGERTGVSKRFLCRVRVPAWYDLHRDKTFPDVIVSAMSNGRFRFIENAARAAITNNLFGLTWKRGVPGSTKTEVLRWLRSADGQAALRAACRVHAGGLRKLEPRALGAVFIPAASCRRDARAEGSARQHDDGLAPPSVAVHRKVRDERLRGAPSADLNQR